MGQSLAKRSAGLVGVVPVASGFRVPGYSTTYEPFCVPNELDWHYR
jgi:hypothetical protein